MSARNVVHEKNVFIQDEHGTGETVISFLCKSSHLVADFRIFFSLRKFGCASALNVSWRCVLQATPTLNLFETIHRIQSFPHLPVRGSFLSRSSFGCVYSSLRLFCKLLHQLVLVLVVEHLTNKIGNQVLSILITLDFCLGHALVSLIDPRCQFHHILNKSLRAQVGHL